MIAPSVHLNGSSPEALQAPLDAAVTAIRGALDAVHATAPNARDYYPQGDDAIRTARREHALRLKRLEDLLAEVAEIRDAVSDRTAARKR